MTGESGQENCPDAAGSNVDSLKAIEPSGGSVMSDFMFLFRSSEAGRRAAMGTPEQAQKSLGTWLAWIRDLELKGHLKSPGQPLSTEGKVVRGKNRIVTDGPFVEAKELVLGFIIVQARDLAEAVQLSTGCPMLEGDGAVEVRPIETGMVIERSAGR
jgi:hypothetical protein